MLTLIHTVLFYSSFNLEHEHPHSQSKPTCFSLCLQSFQSICDYHCILLQTTMSDSAALGGPASSDNPHIVPENTITYVVSGA